MVEQGRPPGRIDRSYLQGMSGGYQSQILAALKSLGLTDADQRPTAELERLVAEPSQLPSYLMTRLPTLYPEAIALAAEHGTQGQLEEVFRSKWGLSGNTLREAIRFYLDASALAGMPTSPNFRVPARSIRPKGEPRPAKRASTSPAKAPAKTAAETPLVTTPTSTQRITLASGGSVMLTIAVDLFGLSESDRVFVFDLVDKLRTYSVGQAAEPVKAPYKPEGVG